MFISGPAEVLEGNSAQYTAVVFPTTMKGSLRWSLEGSRTGASLDSNGLLTTTENGNSDSSLKIRVQFIPEDGDFILVTKDIVEKRRIYPSTSQLSISGATMLSAPETYTLQCSATNITGDYIVEWALGGDIASVAVIENATNSSCVVLPETVMGAVAGTISATARKRYNNSTIGTFSLNISAVNDTIAEADAGVCAALYAAGLCANEGYITKDEARLITAEDLNPPASYGGSIFHAYKSQIKTFDGFKYFTSVLYVPTCLFYESTIKSITLPSSVTSIEVSAFYASQLNSINFPIALSSIKDKAFENCSKLSNIYIESITAWCNLKITGDTSFSFSNNPLKYGGGNIYLKGKLLTEVIIPEEVTSLRREVFYACSNIKSIILHEGITNISKAAFQYSGIESIIIPDNLSTLPVDVFSGCENLVSVKIGAGITSIGSEAFRVCQNLTTIICMRKNSPSLGSNVFGESSFQWTGYNTASQGINTLYVPTDATGYEEGQWLDPLCNSEKCGFTISKTL